MKWAFLTEKGLLEVMDIPSPTLDPGGVLVAMKMAAICRTDLKMVQEGQKDLILPRILGHEGLGEVVESRDPLLREGEVVAIYPGHYCGRCPACLSGHTARCEKIRIFGFNEDGFFRSLVPFTKEDLGCLVRLSRPYPETIVLAEPLACCISALEKFRPERKEVALIAGAGVLGSIFSTLLFSQEWEHVIVADKDNNRLIKELPSGIKSLNISTESILPLLKKGGWDQRIDLFVPCCSDGLSWPFWKVMRPGGCVSIFSGGAEGKRFLPMDTNTVHYRELALVGSYGCNKEDFVTASMMLADGRIDLSFLDLYRVDIESIADGMERLKRKEIKKAVITRF